MEQLADCLETIVPIVAAAGLAVGAMWLGEAVGQRLRPKKPPARYVVSIVDPDGIPTRQDRLSIEGVARLISELNAGRYQ